MDTRTTNTDAATGRGRGGVRAGRCEPVAHPYGATRAATVAVLLLASLAVGAACRDSGPKTITIDDLSTPDTNTAVVVLGRGMPGTDVPSGEERVYAVDQGRVPHVTLGRYVLDADTALVTIVLSDLYATGPVVTDGTLNRFAWRSPTGTEFTPVTPCTLTVRSAYTLGTPSMQAVETACRVTSREGATTTILAKTRRYLPLGGSGSGAASSLVLAGPRM